MIYTRPCYAWTIPGRQIRVFMNYTSNGICLYTQTCIMWFYPFASRIYLCTNSCIFYSIVEWLLLHLTILLQVSYTGFSIYPFLWWCSTHKSCFSSYSSTTIWRWSYAWKHWWSHCWENGFWTESASALRLVDSVMWPRVVQHEHITVNNAGSVDLSTST